MSRCSTEVDAAAKVALQRAGQHADQRAGERQRQAEAQADAKAVEQPRHHVAPGFVGAEPVVARSAAPGWAPSGSCRWTRPSAG